MTSLDFVFRIARANPSDASVIENAAGRFARPRSATGAWTGFVGFVFGALAYVGLGGVDLPAYQKALLLIGAAIIPMMLVDVFHYRTLSNASTGLQTSAVRPLSIERVFRKMLGLLATFGAIYLCYWAFPEYAGDFYKPAWDAVELCAPYFLVATPFYIAYVDRRQHDPEDIYARLGAFLVGRASAIDKTALGQHVRGWLVKGFFLPLMFVYLVNTMGIVWTGFSTASGFDFRVLYDPLLKVTFLFDLLFASVGYICTLRLFDTHIRSTEPTMLGWVVCLLCYQPIWGGFEQHYLNYDADGFYWNQAFQAFPMLFVIWGSAIIGLFVLYVWATIVFGLRFSNLTHRGIITTGPYRWTKHPAYVTKNLSWWLISIPLLSNLGIEEGLRQSVLLLLVNAIYWMRAVTEERHLSFDPEYRAYCAYIREHGLVARLRRLVRPGTR